MLLHLARRITSPRVRAAALAGAGAGATLFAANYDGSAQCLFGFGGGAKPDWDKIKKEIMDLCEDEGAPNPSKDNASGSLGGGGAPAKPLFDPATSELSPFASLPLPFASHWSC